MILTAGKAANRSLGKPAYHYSAQAQAVASSVWALKTSGDRLFSVECLRL